MLRIITSLLLICMAPFSYAQSAAKEKAVRAYYSGFEKNDWNEVSAQFAEGFTFTSPNNDDHISLQKFKEKCWPTSKYIKKVNLIKMVQKGNDLMLLVQIDTVDGSIVRNIDLFTFNNTGKISSIEVFFGAGSKYPGHK